MFSAKKPTSTRDALLRMAAESGGGEGLADLITDQYFPSLFINGNIRGDSVLHDAARRGDSNAIDAILNGGEFSGSKNFKKALCRKRNALGNTALHEGVMMGHVEGVRLLFSADKVVARYPNEECKSPLYLAMENMNEEIVDILFPSASSFLYEHAWRQQPQPTEVPIEESQEIILQRDQPSNSHPNLQVENYKAKEILAPEFYKAITERNVFNFDWTLEPNGNQEELRISDIVNKVSLTGDTLLHAAASLGSQETVEFIAVHFPRLVTMKNIKGDTALHVIARTRNLHNMIIIFSCYAEHSKKGFYTYDNETLYGIKNEYGNTALHEAVMINDIEGASLLFSADKIIAHYLNKENKSPLYLAVENKDRELVDVLLHAPFDNVESHQGNSPLHAAILENRRGGLMKKLLDKRPDLINWRNQKGGTPLHCAASIGYLEGVRTFLKAKSVSALERNTKGYLPIHIASKKGHVKVVKEIVEQEWLDPLTLLNLKGQNPLHIVAKNGKFNVVKYILREKKLEKLLNERDKNGNTPLHLASKYLFPQVLFLLTQDTRVKVNLKNNQCMPGRDIVLFKKYDAEYRGRKLLSSALLYSAGTKTSAKTYRLIRNRDIPERVYSEFKNRINTLMLVAILVAAVTFAAGFTMPGGFNSEDSDPKKRGVATLVNRRMFQVFTICDAVAMYSSTVASFILLRSQLGDLHLGLVANDIALWLVVLALVTMSVAFMAGLHLVVVSLSWLASAVIITGTTFLSLLLFAFSLLKYPLSCRIPIFRHIGLFLIWISIPLAGSVGKLRKNKQKTNKLEQQSQKDNHEGNETQQVRIDMPQTQQSF